MTREESGMELQEKYREQYKGRKGRKRLQELEEEIIALRRETGNIYDGLPEMRLLEEKMPDPLVRVYFLRCFRDLNALWQGTVTYGFLRLCGKWIRREQAEELEQPDVDRMLEELLPSRDWQALTGSAE